MSVPAAVASTSDTEAIGGLRVSMLAAVRRRWTLGAAVAAVVTGAAVLRVAVAPTALLLAVVAGCAAANYALRRGAAAGLARQWQLAAGAALDTALVSTALVAVPGHALGALYLLTPLETAYLLGPRPAWLALAWNLAGLGIVVALVGGSAWVWAEQAGSLVVVSALLIPTLAVSQERLRRVGAALADLADGDLAARLPHFADWRDELGELGRRVNRSLRTVARAVGLVRARTRSADALGRQIAERATASHSTAQVAAAAARALATGVEHERAGLTPGRANADTAAQAAAAVLAQALAAAEHTRLAADEAQRRLTGARTDVFLGPLAEQIDTVGRAAAALEAGAREIAKLVDGITRIASQTDLLALNHAGHRGGPGGPSRARVPGRWRSEAQ